MGFYVTEGKGNPIKQIIDELPFEEYDVYYGDIFVEKNKVKKGILIKNTSMLIGQIAMNKIYEWLQRILDKRKHEVIKLRWEQANLQKKLRQLKND